LFFDADRDGDVDLYVTSGGSEFPENSPELKDRLYMNDGKGNFKRYPQGLPYHDLRSQSTVKATDYDQDGDEDLFIGSRLRSPLYGMPVSGTLLNNDGKGNFTDVTLAVAPALINIGMITDAIWADVDGDKDPDLIVVGEYMPVKILINQSGKFSDQTEGAGLGKSNGWWNRIAAADLDGDGDLDFVLGNHGLNSRFRASPTKPVTMYVSDFDQNGTVEQIICTYVGDKQYPLVLRHDLVAQINSLKKKFLKYESYKDQTMQDIFDNEQLLHAVKLNAYVLSSSLLMNLGGGRFELRALPMEAQFAPVYGILLKDIDRDGIPDILLGGNFYRAKPEVGRYDASYGLFLKGDGKGGFKPVPTRDSGFFSDGEVRDMVSLRIGSSDFILTARNSDAPGLFKIK
jgi:hypothetical protein